MSKHKRARIRQEKLNTPAKKAKRAKKAYYQSQEAKDKWEEKKRRRNENKADCQQQQCTSKAGTLQQHADNQETNQGTEIRFISCPDKPGEAQWCKEVCYRKCPYSGLSKKAPAECTLPFGRILGRSPVCLLECRLNCPFIGC